MSELLSVTEESGKFEDIKAMKGGPIPKEEVLKNIRQSTQFKTPIFLKKEARSGSMIFVAGGPTLNEYINALKTRKEAGDFIVTSNNTHDFLIDNEIIPDICVVIDPKEIVKNYIKKPTKRVKYVIGTCCNPNVMKNLLDVGMEVEKMLVAYGFSDGADLKLQRELYPGYAGNNFLVGGTMMGLRAMPFATLLGFSKIEYYGFDSCFNSNPHLIMEGDPEFEKVVKENEGRFYEDTETKKRYTLSEQGGIFYAYPKKRAESIQLARAMDGRQFITSPAMSYQAKQFTYWVDRMEGRLEVIVHGDSLSSHLLNLHKKKKQHELETIGDRRWTEGYFETQKQLHKDMPYGEWGNVESEMMCRAIISLNFQLKRKIRVLDYGCGKGKLKIEVDRILNVADFVNYDPFVDEFSKEPEGEFDIVSCFDVMEHVEHQCVANTLKYIASKAKYMTMFTIGTEDAQKELGDGRNAHITIRSPQWWLEKLNRYFIPVESRLNAEGLIATCQCFDAKENMDKEMKIVYENK